MKKDKGDYQKQKGILVLFFYMVHVHPRLNKLCFFQPEKMIFFYFSAKHMLWIPQLKVSCEGSFNGHKICFHIG